MGRKKKEDEAPRPRGTGGITFDAERGLYQATAPRSVPGRPKRRFRTETEAQTWLTSITQQAADGLLIEPQRTTVAQFVDSWLATKKREVRENTLADLERSMEIVKPVLGKMLMHKVTVRDVERLLATWHKDGVTAYRQRKSFGHFRQLMRDAMRLQVIPPRNPADAVRAPRYTPRERVVWRADQAAAFAEKHREHPLYPYVHLALTTALRRSELLGLRWQDVDLERATITIRQSVTYLKSQYRFGEPKTPKSRREVHLDAGTVDALRVQVQNVELLRAGRHRDNWQDFDLVFPSTFGTPMSESNLTQTFHRMCEAAGVPVLNLYSLRHTGGSLYHEAPGANLTLLSERMGHTTVAFTQQRYVHPSEAARRKGALSLEELTGAGERLADTSSPKRPPATKGTARAKKKSRVKGAA
jgi:integrase